MTTPAALRLVLFDIDGTLIDAYGAGRRALEESYAIVFGKADVAAHLDPIWFAGKTDLFIFSEVAARSGVTSWEYERRYVELESCYLERLRAGIAAHREKRILPGVEALLTALSGETSETPVHPLPDVRRPALGLMTGNLEAGARIKLDPWGLNRFFPSGGFGSDALERGDIGLVALDRFQRRLGGTIRPDEVLVVGDTAHDVAAARSCGFRVLAVGTGWTESAELRAVSPDHYVDDLSDTRAVLRTIGL